MLRNREFDAAEMSALLLLRFAHARRPDFIAIRRSRRAFSGTRGIFVSAKSGIRRAEGARRQEKSACRNTR